MFDVVRCFWIFLRMDFGPTDGNSRLSGRRYHVCFCFNFLQLNIKINADILLPRSAIQHDAART